MTAIATRLAFLGFALSAAIPASALAAHSGWTDADEAQLRLLLVKHDDGRIEGGVEIALEPGWYTYWRNPGEAGVPPVLDFSGSENVADVAVRYPAPVRHDDGASVSLIYTDAVVLPLAVTPREAGKPLTLHLEATFGVCSDICVPTRASAEVTLSSAPDPLSDERLKSFAPRVPGAPEPGRFDVEAITAEGNDLLIDVRMPASSYSDLFADPPAGWYIGQPSLVTRSGDVSRYRLSLAGRPADVDIKGQTFRFVAVSGGEAIEKAVVID